MRDAALARFRDSSDATKAKTKNGKPYRKFMVLDPISAKRRKIKPDEMNKSKINMIIFLLSGLKNSFQLISNFPSQNISSRTPQNYCLF
jgi:hypothetical protein